MFNPSWNPGEVGGLNVFCSSKTSSNSGYSKREISRLLDYSQQLHKIVSKTVKSSLHAKINKTTLISQTTCLLIGHHQVSLCEIKMETNSQ